MVFTWFRKGREKILAIGWRLALYESFNQFYDKILYPIAMLYLGVTRGWLVMAMGSLLSCAFLFWRYDVSGIDWLFAKTARELETKEEPTWFERMIAKISKSRNGRWGIIVFVLANVNLDPLIVAVHYRESHFGGISRRDWGVLLLSVGIANLWWGARIGLLVELLKWLRTLL